MSYIPDNYINDIVHFEMSQIKHLRHEGVKNAKTLRCQKLKGESTKIKRILVSKIGECEICGFDFKPILQIHHIVPISEYGNNQPENIVCVCPNCHKTLHYIYSRFSKDDGINFDLIKKHNDNMQKIVEILVRYLAMKGEIVEYFESIGFVDTSEE